MGANARRGMAAGVHARRGSVRVIVGALMFLVGALIFILPGLTTLQSQEKYDRELTRFYADVSADTKVPAGASAPATGGTPPADTSAPAATGGTPPADASAPATGGTHPADGGTSFDAAYQFLLAYNERVIAGTAGVVNDPWGIGSNEDAFKGVGLDNAVVGVLRVPRLNVEAPLLLGASNDHLARGACIISGTSAPLGQESSNVAIAGHRGDIFRDIEDIQLGDTLTIETRWGTLEYRAVEFRAIAPDDTAAVGVQPHRDLVTLLSCHPYGISDQRYLAIFERSYADEGTTTPSNFNFNAVDTFSPMAALSKALMHCDSPQLYVERWLRVVGSVLLVLVPLGSCVHLVLPMFQEGGVFRGRGRHMRNRTYGKGRS